MYLNASKGEVIVSNAMGNAIQHVEVFCGDHGHYGALARDLTTQKLKDLRSSTTKTLVKSHLHFTMSLCWIFLRATSNDFSRPVKPAQECKVWPDKM
jgi:hypothetical protein